MGSCVINSAATVFAFSDILTALALKTIGSKVIDQSAFMSLLVRATQDHDVSKDRVPGQHFITLPPAANMYVSGGVGLNTDRPEDYVLAEHRGRVNAYLKRQFALPVESVSCVVYTRDAYCADPDVTEQERQRIGDCTHVLVAVLASAGPPPALSPYRLVHNLAGGNKEAMVWTADEIRAKAVGVKSFDDTYSTVAD